MWNGSSARAGTSPPPLGRRETSTRSTGRGDPRGGVQSDDYRHARPEDLVEEDGVAMSGPGGAPASDVPVEEQRERDRSAETR
jgi:hypothetical protein